MAGIAAVNRTPNPENTADLLPLGKPPRSASARVRRLWREAAKRWPQLSQRDYEAMLDYCRALVEQEELRAQVDAEGRFYENAMGTPKEAPWYTALVRVERRLQSMRRDFAGLAGYRERARAVQDTRDGSGAPRDEVEAL